MSQDQNRTTNPVACVTWWLDACQDRHFEAAPDYVPILKTDLAAKDAEIERLRAAVKDAFDEGYHLGLGEGGSKFPKYLEDVWKGSGTEAALEAVND